MLSSLAYGELYFKEYEKSAKIISSNFLVLKSKSSPQIDSGQGDSLSLGGYCAEAEKGSHIIKIIQCDEKVLNKNDKLHNYLFWAFINLKPGITAKQIKARFLNEEKILNSFINSYLVVRVLSNETYYLLFKPGWNRPVAGGVLTGSFSASTFSDIESDLYSEQSILFEEKSRERPENIIEGLVSIGINPTLLIPTEGDRGYYLGDIMDSDGLPVSFQLWVLYAKIVGLNVKWNRLKWQLSQDMFDPEIVSDWTIHQNDILVNILGGYTVPYGKNVESFGFGFLGMGKTFYSDEVQTTSGQTESGEFFLEDVTSYTIGAGAMLKFFKYVHIEGMAGILFKRFETANGSGIDGSADEIFINLSIGGMLSLFVR
ncbi:MAG: hypothetical protein HQK83_04710 [Fibrobacteria bacterium]|nr:hypothetical protein [Fibrobacteria bacterium]